MSLTAQYLDSDGKIFDRIIRCDEYGRLLEGLQAGPLRSRCKQFAAASDMPANITVAADVSAKRIKFDELSATAWKLQLLFHPGSCTWNGVAGAGPICQGVRVIVNAPDDVVANESLIFTDVAAGGISFNSILDLLVLSAANPFIEIGLTSPLRRVDVIGVPVNTTPTTIIPGWFELRTIG